MNHFNWFPLVFPHEVLRLSPFDLGLPQRFCTLHFAFKWLAPPSRILHSSLCTLHLSVGYRSEKLLWRSLDRKELKDRRGFHVLPGLHPASPAAGWLNA
ncbi:hypothetical protein SBV1_2710008 [Verrucomicrobia bacterium]|nr:hypothetical protein SBV1_2710008 [Verrucomicrobiota bacterium]